MEQLFSPLSDTVMARHVRKLTGKHKATGREIMSYGAPSCSHMPGLEEDMHVVTHYRIQDQGYIILYV